MINIAIHIPSLLVGFLIGAIIVGFVDVIILYDSRWDIGFSDGWKCGAKYTETKAKDLK